MKPSSIESILGSLITIPPLILAAHDELSHSYPTIILPAAVFVGRLGTSRRSDCQSPHGSAAAEVGYNSGRIVGQGLS